MVECVPELVLVSNCLESVQFILIRINIDDLNLTGHIAQETELSAMYLPKSREVKRTPITLMKNFIFMLLFKIKK